MPVELLKRVSASYINQTTYTPYGGEPMSFNSTVQTSMTDSFTKADLVVNERQHDGFRQPSDYYGQRDWFAFTATVTQPRYADPVAFGVWEYGKFGDIACRVRPADAISVQEVERRLRDPLRTKILINIKDEVLDVAMVLAEMQGTCDVITNGLYKIARTMDAVRARKPESFYYLMNGRRRDARRPTDKFLRETAKTYLEWKYGVMPTIMDVQGASRALDINEEGSLFDNPALMVARANLQEELTEEVSVFNQDWPNATADIRCRVMASARADYSVNAEGIRGLSRYGIGLGTVATIAFERTPFSFVLNMAFPLAELIKAWTSLSGGVDVRGYSETFAVEYTVLAGRYPFENGGFLTWPAGSTCLSFKRNGSGSIPMPLPFVRNPLKAGNLATALALFTQLRGVSK